MPPVTAAPVRDRVPLEREGLRCHRVRNPAVRALLFACGDAQVHPSLTPCLTQFDSSHETSSKVAQVRTGPQTPEPFRKRRIRTR